MTNMTAREKREHIKSRAQALGLSVTPLLYGHYRIHGKGVDMLVSDLVYVFETELSRHTALEVVNL